MTKVEVKKKAATKGVSAWSISRLNTYEQCPFKFKLTVLDGLKEPGSQAMDRGAEIHKQAELYLKDALKEVPESCKLLGIEFEEAKDLRAKSELEITFTKDWQPCGWFDKEAWLRLKIDILVFDKDTIKLIDIKTGKNRGGYEDQLEIYALAALVMYPDIKHVAAELWYVDSGEIVGTSHGAYTHDMTEALKKKWEARVLPMFVDDIMAPRPNKFCGFCFARKSNGGPCEW